MGVIGQSSKLRGYPYRLFDGMHQARAAKHIGRRTIAARVIADERASIVTRKPKPLNDPRHTATHEAGHAVIARVLTLLCEGASIVPDHEAGHAGHSISGDPWECETEWLRRGKVRHDNAVWHARIISCMAGAEAEAVLLGSTEGGDGDDRYQIELIAKELLDCDAAQWVRHEARLRAMTRMLIRRHRDRIERVADALLADGELSAEQIDLLAGRSINDLGEMRATI
jgi:ATP-dependent Zn protease